MAPQTVNHLLGPDASANHALFLLRQDTFSGKIATDTEILPGIALHADPALPLSGNFVSPEGRLLELDVSVMGESWFALHIALSNADLTAFGLLGFASRNASPTFEIIRPCLRSGTNDGFVDCFFDKHILAPPGETSHLDALQLHPNPRIPPQAPWRELVFFLPTHPFQWALMDLRIFTV